MICAGCGRWADEPRVAVADGASSVHCVWCVHCGWREPFTRLPLFAVTGPSGTGKSTVCRMLPALLGDRVVVLEQDLLWVDALRDPTGESAAFRRTWLRLAASIHQSGRPTVLCGTVAPPEFECWPERALLADIHYLGLVCAPETLRARLLARPAWRQWGPGRIEEMLEFGEWMRHNAAHTTPPMRLLDTGARSAEETAADVADWIRGHLREPV